jgi:hypothetical protein
MERDERGALALRSLLTAGRNDSAAPDRATGGEKPTSGPAPAITVALLTVEEGGARVVDQSITPQFAVDLRHLALTAEGLSTGPGAPAHVDLKGQAGGGTVLALRGTVGPLGGPVALDLSGELRGFDAARVNPYLSHYVAWEAAQGTLGVRIQGRVKDDGLDGRADVQLSRLQVVRTPSSGPAASGGGLPLNVLVALMRDSRGDIRLAFPVGGQLSDPRFDFREAIRSAIRTVALNTIALPVSWIGRLRVGQDSRIESVEVDPIQFNPGSAELTPDGRAQATRVAAFLGQVGEVRMALTPVVSDRDLAVLRRRAAETAIERVASGGGVSAETAAAQLFRERLPGRLVPAEPEALLTALADTEASPAHAPALAARRLETLLTALKEAGVARARLVEAPPAERADSTAGMIELNVLEPDSSRRS